jgi:hypothetical protein
VAWIRNVDCPLTEPTRCFALFFLLAAAGAGCNQSHGPQVGGIDGNTRMHDLTREQWEAFCGWYEDLRGDRRLYYACDLGMVRPDECVGTEMPPCYDWRASACLSLAGLRGRWTGGWTPECDSTVSEVAACVEFRSQVDCWSVLGTGEACARAYCVDYDAGPVDGG